MVSLVILDDFSISESYCHTEKISSSQTPKKSVARKKPHPEVEVEERLLHQERQEPDPTVPSIFPSIFPSIPSPSPSISISHEPRAEPLSPIPGIPWHMHQEQHRRGPGQDPKTSWRNAGAFCFFLNGGT